MSRPLVAIVGRPNVGKSTLFNRIVGRRRAIVHDEPGVTRDRHYADADWAGKAFTVVDTGAFVPQSDDVFEAAIRVHAQVAMELADAVASRQLGAFLEVTAGFAARAAHEPAALVIEGIVEGIGFEPYLEKSYPGEGYDRMENVRSLVSAAAEHEKEAEEAGERATLHGFLDRSALVSDADEVGREPGVTLMTIHNPKGLEFPVVFLAGMEENLFPHARSTGNDEDLEEERRLCYDAMRCAKRRLFLSLAASRFVQGTPQSPPPSRFLDEIPDTVLAEDRPAAPPSFLKEPQAAWGSSAARPVRPAVMYSFNLSPFP